MTKGDREHHVHKLVTPELRRDLGGLQKQMEEYATKLNDLCRNLRRKTGRLHGAGTTRRLFEALFRSVGGDPEFAGIFERILPLGTTAGIHENLDGRYSGVDYWSNILRQGLSMYDHLKRLNARQLEAIEYGVRPGKTKRIRPLLCDCWRRFWPSARYGSGPLSGDSC